MEKIAERWAHALSQELKMDDYQEAMMSYGLKILFSLLLSYSFTLILAYIFGVWRQVLILLITSSVFRMISGGAHASSPYICAFFGATVSTALAIVAKGLGSLPLYLVALTMLLATYVVIKWVPAGNPKRPQPSLQRKRRFKILSMLFIILWGVGVILTREAIPDYVAASALGLWWQLFTLTPLGYGCLDKVDTFLLKGAYFIKSHLS